MILFDENASTFYLFHAGMRWIAVRLDFIAGSVILNNLYNENRIETMPFLSG